MNLLRLQKSYIAIFIIIISLVLTACDDEFYLSEKEVAAFASTLETHGDAHQFYGSLKYKTVNLQFDNSSGTPKLQSTNLVDVMRQTNLASLENGYEAVSLVRLEEELRKQIGNWVEGRLDLYIDEDDDKSRLEKLESVSVYFLTNPEFIYNADKQSISFDVRLRLTMNGTIKIKAVNWLVNIFANVNGTYPLMIKMDDLQLKGEANVFSPYVNGGRTRFQLTPKILSPIQVLETTDPIPNRVKDGAKDLLTYSLSQYVDEVFHQDYDYFALSNTRLTNDNPNRLEVKYRAKSKEKSTDSAKPQMHVVATALDGKLYHSQKYKGDWSEYKAITFPGSMPPINLEPTLIHSGGNQLELASTDQNGNLVYSHFRDEEWGNFRINTPSSVAYKYLGKPAVATSAPGQAEIIVAGYGGSLWHLRRKNGVWITAIKVPLAQYTSSTPMPYRDPSAVQVGNKIVVVFVDGQNNPNAIAFDLETEIWGQPTKVSNANQTQTQLAPALVASGDSRADVVFVGQDSYPYHRELRIKSNNIIANTPTTQITLVNNEKRIGGVKTVSTPMLTSATYHQPELIIRRSDTNRLYHNHFVNALGIQFVDGQNVLPGWQNWTMLNDSFFSDKIKLNGRVSEFNVAATNSGKIEVVARQEAPSANYGRPIYYNSFEANRFATAPWKTVHWRGWEQTQNVKFKGRPSIAVADSNFATAFIGKTGGVGAAIQKGNLAELNLTNFTQTTEILRTTGDNVEPLVLSTGTGISDTFAIRGDGKISHQRNHNNGSGVYHKLSPPEELTGISAASYGNGYIELVGRGTNDKVYHWRFRDGNWSGSSVIATGVISSPIIKYIGAGQLELMGIDFDTQLKRWRFYENRWHQKLNVPQTIRIDEKLFNSVSASSWGDGTIDLAIVDKDNQKLYHRRIGPGDEVCNQPFGCPPQRQFAYMNDKSFKSPVLSAFSPTRLNVLSNKGQIWYSSWSSLFNTPIQYPEPPIQWSSFEKVGGSGMLIGNVAHSGRYNLAAVATANGEIHINRNQNGNWSGFQRIYGQTTEQRLSSPIFLPAISAKGN